MVASAGVLVFLLVPAAGGQLFFAGISQSWSDTGKIIATCLGAYLLGSIPFGYIVVGMLRERDITAEGSGRTGGTNAMRVTGVGGAALTIAGDVFKGVAAIALARAIVPASAWAEVWAGWCAVLGHNASVFVRFRGGAGSSPNMGVAFAFWPPSLVITVLCLPFSWLVIGYASVGSIFIGLVIVAIFGVRAAQGLGPVEYMWYGVGALVMVLYALRPNIERLLNGTEKRIGLPARRRNVHPHRTN